MDEKLEKMSVIAGFISKLLDSLHIKDFRTLLIGSTISALTSSHENTNIEYGFRETKPDPEAISYLETRAIILSEKTASRIEGDLKFELLEGLKASESIDQMTERIGKVFKAGTPRWQLERIARSEIIDSQNAGRLSAYKASNVTKYKMWVAAKGVRLCALCKRLNGQIQPLDKPFVDPEDPSKTWMHPIAHPNGRCSTVPLRKLPDDVVKIGGQMYDASRVTKIELPSDLFKSQDKIPNKSNIVLNPKNISEIEFSTLQLEKFSKEGLIRKKVPVHRLGKEPTMEYRYVKAENLQPEVKDDITKSEDVSKIDRSQYDWSGCN